jgi:hypothetical protein
MIRFLLEDRWVLATYYIQNEKYFVSIKDWHGISSQTIILSKEEFSLKTEAIKERNI